MLIFSKSGYIFPRQPENDVTQARNVSKMLSSKKS
jgi:hypothetical protein